MHIDKKIMTILIVSTFFSGVIGGLVGGVIATISSHRSNKGEMYRSMGNMRGGVQRLHRNNSFKAQQSGDQTTDTGAFEVQPVTASSTRQEYK